MDAKAITLNGQTKQTFAANVEALVAELGLKRGTVLVEHNGVALRANEWPSTPIRGDDRLELLKIVAGG
jgi:sulfur carrier protein